MADLIDRQAAIDSFWKLDIEMRPSAIDAITGILEQLPSAQPEQRWIPCSERLPKKSGQYYVSGGDKVWICEFLVIPNFASGWCNNVSNPAAQAWMPLPEPYQEGEQNG